jgi:hypothetical protein
MQAEVEIFGLNNATLTILKSSFELYEYKLNHSTREYRIFLELKGWTKGSPAERRAIRVGNAFYNGFSHCPHALEEIEPKVIYSLAQGRYTSAIAQLESYPINRINQELVLELMTRVRKSKQISKRLLSLDERSEAYIKEIASITSLGIKEILANAISHYHSQVIIEREIILEESIKCFN